MANRKYYKINATRVPPYSAINGSYPIEEHVYAYSEDGARNTFYKYHKNSYGSYVINAVHEISKDEFKGHHRCVY